MSIIHRIIPDKVTKSKISLKSTRRDGLFLELHRSSKTKPTNSRFVQTSFSPNSIRLAVLDNYGHVFLVDLASALFWGLPDAVGFPCRTLCFPPCSDELLVIGTSNGHVCAIDTDSGGLMTKHRSHEEGVVQISFSRKSLCLSLSGDKAVIWDFKHGEVLLVLKLATERAKFMAFIPVSDDVIGCFSNILHIWKSGSFENFKQILPVYPMNYTIKCLAFTRNGRVMLVAGYSSQIVVFLLDTWNLANIINLPETISSVTQIEFIPKPFDGGCNKILCVLSGQGTIFFFDMEEYKIISKLNSKQNIVKFTCSRNGTYLSCTLRSGEIQIFCISKCLSTSYEENTIVLPKRVSHKTKRVQSIRTNTQEQLSKLLVSDKLLSILKQFGQYPSNYRTQIWSYMLQLPCNKNYYSHLLNQKNSTIITDFEKQYPLENKTSLKNMKSLLKSLTTWWPFLQEVEYLPVFVYPFIQVLGKTPLICFEAVATVLINICQHWFSDHPHPPTAILTIVENLLIEHDVDLLRHLRTIGAGVDHCVWPVLEAAFTEVLTAEDWCAFWDHVVSNEPAFLLCAAAAHVILVRKTLMTVRDPEDARKVCVTKLVQVKSLLQGSYKLMGSTSEDNHPRRYLDGFKKLEVGVGVE